MAQLKVKSHHDDWQVFECKISDMEFRCCLFQSFEVRDKNILKAKIFSLVCT